MHAASSSSTDDPKVLAGPLPALDEALTHLTAHDAIKTEVVKDSCSTRRRELKSKFMSPVTPIMHTIAEGDPEAASQLLPLVYDELRILAAKRLARETPGQTLQPTGLVHEAYLRLVG